MTSFANIFDDLPDTLDEWISVGKELAPYAGRAMKSTSELSQMKKKTALESQFNGSPTNNSFGAGRTSAAVSEDYDGYQERWRKRIATFAGMAEDTRVK